MEIEPIAPTELPSRNAPLTPAIKVGNQVYVSGQLGISPQTGRMVEGDVVAQARQALENISVILRAAGTTMSRVVKTTVYVTDIEYRTQIGSVYAEFFPPPSPARTVLGVKELADGGLIEIEAIAVI